jgi:cysteine desulfurase
MTMTASLSIDRATTTPLSPEVAEAMRPWLRGGTSIPAASGRRGRAAREALDGARASVAALCGASPDEIVFTASATESNNLALKGIAAAAPRPGRLIAAATEHHSVLHPLRTLERLGHQVVLLPVDAHGAVDPEAVRRALRDGGGLVVSIAHASGEIGTIQPIADLARVTREAGVPFHCDASLSLGRVPFPGPPDAPDLVTATAHLMGGPPGAAALRIRRGLRVRPLVEGGLQEGGLRAGTEALALLVGFGVAADRAGAAHLANAPGSAAATACRRRLLEILPDTRLTGHPETRLPGHLSLCLRGVEAEAVLLGLEEEGIEAGSGSACTTEAGKPSHVLLALGIDPVLARGAVTLAFGEEHTPDDGRRAAEALGRVVPRLRSLSPFGPLVD